jgi:hypothetical protein
VDILVFSEIARDSVITHVVQGGGRCINKKGLFMYLGK